MAVSLRATEFYLLVPAAAQLSLPAGGGTFELLADGTDLVVREQGAAELFRDTLESVQRLNVNGSVVMDEVRGQGVIVGLTDGKIPWPSGKRGRAKLIDDAELDHRLLVSLGRMPTYSFCEN